MQESAQQKPLPVTIVASMKVVPIDDALVRTIRGITQAHCIFQLNGSERICVAAWPELALAYVCPAPQLLPADVTQRDRSNAQAALLRELLNLQQFGLTPMQQAVLAELVADLCGVSLAAK